MNIAPVTLTGVHVRLEPLEERHLDELCAVGLEPELWRWSTEPVTTRDAMSDYVRDALELQAQGSALPFVIRAINGAQVVGSTRYGAINQINRRREIGWTWVALPWQRSAINTETKFLLLRHAFETLNCLRVEFKTDALNAQSRAALTRIGATQEGIFRSHMVTSSGRIRDSIYFSIIATEWPAVKERLTRKLLSQGNA